MTEEHFYHCGRPGDFADRYYAKRQAGISPTRSDGSQCTAETDRQAGAAEKHAADVLGCEFNAQVTETGDGGYDFVFPLTVEVVWLGMSRVGLSRATGRLIVNPYEPHRWADLYVVVRGSVEQGFSILGWTTHRRLAGKPHKDFGYGPKMAMHTSELEPLSRLLALKDWRNEGEA